MGRYLVSWLGRNDIENRGVLQKYSREKAVETSHEIGPIASALVLENYESVRILSNYAPETYDDFFKWVSTICKADIEIGYVPMDDPMDLNIILEASRSLVQEINNLDSKAQISYHISPGTSVMAVSLMICESTVLPGRIIQSSRETGVREFNLPLVMSVAARRRSEQVQKKTLSELSAGEFIKDPAFEKISCRSTVMKETVRQAMRFAPAPAPVLILGDNGTGKEVFAKSIHQASSRSAGPMKSLNCGAIAESIIESELFGHTEGAFTDARRAKKGIIRSSDGGTLFLDEIGELSPGAQVKLLRVLQENEVMPVGGEKADSVDFRLVCATNRNLLEDVRNGRFREDLFHRIGVGIIKLPSLKDREEDLNSLIDEFLGSANTVLKDSVPEYREKHFSPNALDALQSYHWPGNIRELQNTITRLCLVVDSGEINVSQVQEQLLYPALEESSESDSGKPIAHDQAEITSLPQISISDEDFSLNIAAAQAELYRSYIKEAARRSNGKLSEMAQLLGAKNYQSVANWMKKYGIAEEHS